MLEGRREEIRCNNTISGVWNQQVGRYLAFVSHGNSAISSSSYVEGEYIRAL